MRRFALYVAIVFLTGPMDWASAADMPAISAPPNLTAARARIKVKDFAGALALMRPLLDDYKDADLYNLMGFSLRKTGDQKQAFVYYRKALDLKPDHLGALEYQGELFVETGQIDKARENAAHLKKLCPKGCEQLEDLEAAIAKAPKS